MDKQQCCVLIPSLEPDEKLTAYVRKLTDAGFGLVLVVDDQEILIALQNYHFTNFDEFLGVPLKEVSENMRPRAVASAVNNIFEEYFATHPGLDARVEGRIVIEE